jgi:hypothetical protein
MLSNRDGATQDFFAKRLKSNTTGRSPGVVLCALTAAHAAVGTTPRPPFRLAASGAAARRIKVETLLAVVIVRGTTDTSSAWHLCYPAVKLP